MPVRADAGPSASPVPFCLANHQDESAAVSTTLAAKFAGVPTRSLDQYVGYSRSGDLGGRDGDLQ